MLFRKSQIAGLAAIMGAALVPLTLSNPTPSFAGASCNSSKTGLSNAQAAMSAYTDAKLGLAHMLITILNDGIAAIPADFICHFINDMSMPTTGLTLPFDTTKTFKDQSGVSNNVELKVVSPTESFAATMGYTAKATILYNSTVYANMWWGGSGKTAKGFMNIHPLGFSPTNAMYLQFDLTNATAQTIKVWATGFDSHESASNVLGTGSDFVMYGRIVFNSTTDAITGNVTHVQNDANRSNQVDCNRIVIASGSSLGTTLVIGTNSGSPITVNGSNWTSKTAGFNTVSVADSTSTASSAETTSSATPTEDFACSDVYGSIATGGILANGDSSDSAVPSTVFPD